MDYNKVLNVVLHTGKVGFDEAKLSDTLKTKWLTIWSMGLAGEIAEMYTECSNANYYKMLDELADVCWYTVAIDQLLERDAVKDIKFIDYDVVCYHVQEKIENPKPFKPVLIDAMLSALRYTETVKKYARDYPERALDSVVGYIDPILCMNGVLDFGGVGDTISNKLLKRYPNGFTPKDSVNR
jgi:NTP pyrophosphatase (non-canonical NTP hydrolase)